MSENQEQKVVPIRRNIKIGPPSRTEVQVVQVDPQLRIVAENKPETEQPAQPNKRRLLKGLAAALGIFATGGTAIASQSETGQKIMAASPFTQHPDRRPPVDQQLKEIRQDIRSKNSPNKPSPQVEPTQEALEKQIKATMQANPDNRSPITTPTPNSRK
jgi:flagellar biogenesis protein FliO